MPTATELAIKYAVALEREQTIALLNKALAEGKTLQQAVEILESIKQSSNN
ncbi:MAG: hypothetical protein LBU36_05490 [Clostridiales bacterium]|jgi:hypothetical protein|nr:hypothetical protein [Clostridiales bacterium]